MAGVREYNNWEGTQDLYRTSWNEWANITTLAQGVADQEMRNDYDDKVPD